MDYCDVCGGEVLFENGIFVCSQCAHPSFDEKQESFLPFREVYAHIREGDFTRAEEELKELLSVCPRSPELYWGMVLVRYGVVYDQGGVASPSCTKICKKRVFDDPYFKKAIAYSEGNRYEYYKYEAMRIENAHRDFAYKTKSKKSEKVDYYAYEPIDDVFYERDVTKKKKVSWLMPVALVLAFILLTSAVLFLFLGFAKNTKPKDNISVQFRSNPTVYAGQSLDSIRDSLYVIHMKNGVPQPITDYTLEGTLKAGTSVITISYQDMQAVIDIHVLGVDGTEGLTYRSIPGGLEVASYAGSEKKVEIPYYYGGTPVVAIGEGAFFQKQINEVLLHDQITSIGISAFAYSDIQSIVIPSSVTSMGGSSFFSCHSLTTARVDTTVMGEAMFADCISLSSVQLAPGTTLIPTSVFSQCKSIRAIEIPSSVKSIGSYAFAACTSLREFYFPFSLEVIERGAFSYIGELSYPHFEGDFDLVYKGADWSLGTRFGPFLNH